MRKLLRIARRMLYIINDELNHRPKPMNYHRPHLRPQQHYAPYQRHNGILGKLLHRYLKDHVKHKYTRSRHHKRNHYRDW